MMARARAPVATHGLLRHQHTNSAVNDADTVSASASRSDDDGDGVRDDDKEEDAEVATALSDVLDLDLAAR